MKISYLPAVRWFKTARKSLPEPRFSGQSVSERSREILLEEVQWYAGLIARAEKRRQ